ncbi:MAG: sialidase family protein [Kiritimatiellae bacterium]|nr:sialidase family protein [Kiritimatiellia bacterium]
MPRPTLSIAFLLLALAAPLLADGPKDHQYDIVKAGKLTENARFAGKFHPLRDQKDDGTFTFGHLHNYLHAGAGFTSPDARVFVKLSLATSNTPVPGRNYGAILSINNMGLSLEQDTKGRFHVGYGVKGWNGDKLSSTHTGPPLPIIPSGTPFEMEVILKDGDMTVNVNGDEACYLRKCPQLKHMQPAETVASHGLDLIVALRPWQEKEMKVYDFYVETKGKLVELPEIQEVFRGVRSFRREDLKPGTTHLYRIPALTVTKKGTLLAFAEARRDNASDHGNIDTVLKRSEDGGKTWGPELIVADDGENTMGNPCPVVDQDTGRIWLHLSWNGHKPPEGGYKPGFGKDSRRAFVTYSDDDGKTWAPAKEITQHVKKENWSWYATGPGAGIQLTRGEHKGRLIIPATHGAHAPKKGRSYHSFIVYSDDHGKTWNIGEPTKAGHNESTAVELENGNVMLNSRLHGGATSSQNHRGVSISGDGGKTFGRHYFDKTLLEPRCQGSIRRVRWAKDDKPGMIAFSNPAYPWRAHVMVRYSYDDGRTWPAGRIIYPHTSAYSDLAVLPDGRVAVMLEKDWWGSLGMAILPPPPADAPPAKKK